MNYRVSVEGAGFQHRGRAGMYGFLTHCFIAADTEEIACERALASVRAKVDESTAVWTTASRIHVAEVCSVTGELPGVRQQGLIWFDEST